ncbi:MAG: hypothetical protein HZA92_13665 [Verrucomicrobia bacterium]|nr:hypothetical protein [Verrucomicrobiota bacterium]
MLEVGFRWDSRVRLRAEGLLGRRMACLSLLMFFASHLAAFGRVIPVNTCVANLTSIDGAVQQWALERKLMATNTYSFENPELLSYLKGSTLPRCPSGGRYWPAANIAGEPRCSVHGKRSQPIDAERKFEEFKWRGEAGRAMVISLCALMLAFLSRELQGTQSLGCKVVAALSMTAGVGWCLRMVLMDAPRSAFPLMAFSIYAASGTLVFASLCRDSRIWIRVSALIAATLLGLLTLVGAAAVWQELK